MRKITEKDIKTLKKIRKICTKNVDCEKCPLYNAEHEDCLIQFVLPCEWTNANLKNILEKC